MKGFRKLAAGIGQTVLVFGLILFVMLYALSLPRPWFEAKANMSTETIQAGPISSVWITAAAEEEGKSCYVHVKFSDGRERKCTLTTVGLRKRDCGPAAYIYRVQYPGDKSWKFIVMNVELPGETYWQLRRAGWPILGERFQKPIRIDF